MILFVLAYLVGVLTIVSPCILPVLPFVFARADRLFIARGLPPLAGMAATFALVATLAAAGGGWVAEANDSGRLAALTLLALFGITLLFPSSSDRPSDDTLHGARRGHGDRGRGRAFVLP
jgi:cytochrome c biogenesis protein CcdA